MFKDFNDGMSLRKMEKKYNIERHKISDVLKIKKKVIIKTSRDHTIENKNNEPEMIKLYNEGYNLYKISRMLHCSICVVKSALIKKGIINYEPTKIDSDIVYRYNVLKQSIGRISKEVHKSRDTIGFILEYNNVETSKTNRVQHFNENIFNNINTSNKAYWLGFIYADGYVNEERHQLEIVLCNKDLDQIKKFIKFIDGEGIKINKKEIKLKNYNKTYFANRIILTSKQLMKDLVKLGCWQNKSLDKRAPRIDNKFNKDFIAGYFDGNGSIYVKNDYISITISTGSKYFISFLERDLNKNKIKYRVNKDKRSRGIDISTSGTSSAKLFLKTYMNNKRLNNTYMDRKLLS